MSDSDKGLVKTLKINSLYNITMGRWSNVFALVNVTGPPTPPGDQEVKKVADKLATFVAKNGRQFENITREKNPGDTPFRCVFLLFLILSLSEFMNLLSGNAFVLEV